MLAPATPPHQLQLQAAGNQSVLPHARQRREKPRELQGCGSDWNPGIRSFCCHGFCLSKRDGWMVAKRFLLGGCSLACFTIFVCADVAAAATSRSVAAGPLGFPFPWCLGCRFFCSPQSFRAWLASCGTLMMAVLKTMMARRMRSGLVRLRAGKLRAVET